MAVDEFGREVPADRSGRRGDRSPSPGPYGSPSRGGGSGGGSSGAPQEGAPTHLFEALPTSRYGRSSDDRGGGGRDGGGSSRKRRHRSESPSHHSRKDGGGRDGGGRKSSKHKPHPSKLYADEPMLCQFLWKESNGGKSSPAEGDDDNNNSEESNSEYDEYRKGYCLNYIRTFFNEHMDDSWYRSKYSPLDAHRAALQEVDRATREASQMVSELEESLEKKDKQQQSNIGAAASAANGSTNKCSFIMNSRLGGGVKQPRRLPGDEYHSSPQKRGGATNHVPSAHVLSLANQVMPIFDVPPQVTDEQLTMALMSHCTSPAAAAASRDNTMRIYSGSPAYSGDLHRTAYFFAPDEIRKDIITQLNNLDRGGAAAGAGEPAAATGHVPRKEDTYVPKVLELVVECSDAYGRMEIDADGKGGAPEDEGGVPPRKSHVLVSTQPLSSVIQVLSAAVSSRERIRKDAHYALTLANALDQKRNIPPANRLSELLQKALLPLATTLLEDPGAEDGDGGSDEKMPSEDVEDALDVSIAYLRRVHLFCFYNGCSIAPNVGDVLSHNHATSTIHLRLSNADEILRQKEEKAAESAPVSTTQEDSEKTETTTAEGEVPAPVETAAAPAPATKTVDLLEQRLNDAIEKALQQLEPWYKDDPPAAGVVVDAETDAQAQELQEAESQVEGTWIQDHAFIDEDGRARCSFHFCRKLFKDSTFLKKHLRKKHSEFLRAEMAKCHDSYMMKAWDTEEKRPVPPVLVDCGRAFGLVPSPVIGGASPNAADPEPELWRRQEERRKQQEEEQQMRRERYNQHHHNRDNDPYRNDPSGGLDSALSAERPSRQDDQNQGPKPSRGGFVDVDDMKVEKVEMAFDAVEVPVQPPKKKRKKKKLL